MAQRCVVVIASALLYGSPDAQAAVGIVVTSTMLWLQLSRHPFVSTPHRIAVDAAVERGHSKESAIEKCCKLGDGCAPDGREAHDLDNDKTTDDDECEKVRARAVAALCPGPTLRRARRSGCCSSGSASSCAAS